MRIRRLNLIRYGHFTGLTLDLPTHYPDLHIVFGVNEAGKSTALSSIEDVLFGIPQNTPLGFLHERTDLLLGAELERDGSTLALHRRSGRKETLLSPQGLPSPAGETALSTLLGGADRAFLTRMFSMNHQRLHSGGQEIIEAKSEIGQMLFAAGTGLAGLRETLAALAEEADGLWGPRRAAHRTWYKATDRLDTADRALRLDTITAAQWHEAKTAYDEAHEHYTALERQIEELTAEQSRLARLRRVFPFIRHKMELEAKIAALGEVAALPEDARQLLQDSERSIADASGRIEELTDQLEALRASRDVLTVNARLLDREQEITLLNDRRVAIQKERSDLPKRRAELTAVEAQLRRQAADLDWETDDIDALASRMPSPAKVGVVRTLQTRKGERFQKEKTARDALSEAEIRLADLQRRREAMAIPADVVKLAAMARVARGTGDLTLRSAAALRESDMAQDEFTLKLATMRPAMTEEALVKTSFLPSPETVREHRDRGREQDQAVARNREAIETTERELSRQRKEILRLAGTGGAVALGDLAAARQHRDTGWNLIRRHFIESSPVPESDIRAYSSSAEVLTQIYEQAVQTADNLADRRFDTAEATARLAHVTETIAGLEETLRELAAETAVLDENRRARGREWRDLWCDAPFAPLPPDEMLHWMAARTEALTLIQQRNAAQRQWEALRQEESTIRSGLLGEIDAIGVDASAYADQPLAVLIEVAFDMVRQHEKTADESRRLTEEIQQAERDTERKAEALVAAEAAKNDWRGSWKNALAALGLDPAVPFEAVTGQIDTFEKMRESIARIHSLRHERIGTIERDLTAFAEDTAALAGMLAPDLASLQPDDAVLQIKHRLDEAMRIHTLKVQKTEDITVLEQKITDREAACREARAQIGRLEAAAGVLGIDNLRAAIERSARRLTLDADKTKQIEELRVQGDGLSIAELEQECAAIDIDRITQRNALLGEELRDLQARFLEARDRRTETRRVFEAIGGDDRAARAAAARQEALADMRLAAEHYVRVRSAALMLHWAIDRYRRDKQAPLLQRAGEYFALLTSGSFHALRVGFDKQDRPHLNGVRPDNSEVPVSGMSAGTADQLYLALRIASVMDYLNRSPSLPFIADDLFVNFDDRRAAAGFRVLGRLAEATQVIVFTHHHHLVEIARETLGASIPVLTLDGQSARL